MKGRHLTMTKRRAARKAKVALAAVNEDSESDGKVKKEAAKSESSFEGSSSSEEERKIETKRSRKATTVKRNYEFNSSDSSSTVSSSGETSTQVVKLQNKRSRLVKPTKGSSESSSEEEDFVMEKEKPRRLQANPMANRNKVEKIDNFQDSSSRDEERPVRENVTQLQNRRNPKSAGVSSSINLAGSSSSSSEESSELEEKMLPKKHTVRSSNNQVNYRSIKGSSASSSITGDDSELQSKKPRLVKSGNATEKVGSSSNFGLMSSSSSSSSDDGELEQKPSQNMAMSMKSAPATKKLVNSINFGQMGLSSSSSSDDSDLEERSSQKKANSVKSSNNTTNVIDFRKLGSSGSSEEDSEVEGKLPQKVRSPSKDAAILSSASDSSSSDEELENQQQKQTLGPSESSKIAKVVSDSSDFDELSSSSEEDVETQNEPLNIEPKTYDHESESSSSEGSSASDSDSVVAWQPQVEKTKEGEKSDDEDDIVKESKRGSDSEMEEDAWQDDGEFTEDEVENDGNMSESDVRQAKYVLRNITSCVPLIEETAIWRGVIPTGPPIEFATTHLDEYARKFRWPQHVRNLRKTEFSQDPSEVLEDYEVLADTKQPSAYQDDEDAPDESPFAQVPRPMVALAAEALRRSSRKRKRSVGCDDQEGSSEQAPSASALLNIARIGGRFGDEFVESLLSANGKALQGIDSGFDYDKRCWSSLPTKKKPIANWRFVLEHARRTMRLPGHSDAAICPPIKQETLERITKRLKNLYGHATRHEEYDIFKVASVSKSNDTAPEGES